MSIRYVVILIVVIATFGLAGAWVSRHVIMPPFVEMDRQHIGKNMQRNINALLDIGDEMEVIAHDWAAWDDAYQFVQDGNKNFLESNLVPDAFENIRADILVFFNSHDEVVWGSSYAANVGFSPVQISADGKSLISDQISIDIERIRIGDKSHSGIYLSNNQALLFAVASIVDSNGLKPSKGRLLIVRYITPKLIENLGYKTESEFSISPAFGEGQSNLQKKISFDLAKSGQSILLEKNDKLQMHNVVPTVDGGHLLITTSEKKSFSSMASSLMEQVLAWLVIGGIIIFAIVAAFIRFYIINPVARISRHVKTAMETADYSLRLDINEKNDVGNLGRNIDNFLAILSDNLLELRKFHCSLDEELKQKKILEHDLHFASQKLRLLASIDGLTSLANRRVFDEHLWGEWCRMRRHQRYLTLILLDVDHFKQYNDVYGHLKGDECLISISRSLKQLFKRSEDLVARYEGEKFAILLAECAPEAATNLAEKVVSVVAGLHIENNTSKEQIVTCSVGACTVIPHENLSHENLLKQAEINLSKAKFTGRNQAWMTVLSESSISVDGVLEGGLAQKMGDEKRQY